MSAPFNISGLGGFGTESVDVEDFLSGGLELFKSPPVEQGLEGGKDVELQTANPITDKGPYTFILNNDGQEFTFLPLTRLYGVISVREEDGTALSESPDVSLVNLAPYALFNEISVVLNGVTVTQQMTKNSHYEAWFVHTTSYSDEAKWSHLRGLHRYHDDVIGHGADNKVGDDESALHHRRDWIKGSRKMDFSIPIHSPLFHCYRLLKPQVSLEITFHRNNDEFVLMAPPPAEGQTAKKYVIKVHDLKLIVRKIIVTQPALIAHHQLMNSTHALYPFVETRVLDSLIAQNTTVHNQNSLIRNKLPVQIVVGFVPQSAYKGEYTSNGFYFKHYDIDKFYTRINGTSVPQTAFTPDFDNDLVAKEYRAFVDSLQIAHGNISNGISRERWLDGHTLFALDFTPEKCGAFHTHQEQLGNLDIVVHFKKPTPHPVVMLTFIVLNREAITITKEGEVTVHHK